MNPADAAALDVADGERVHLSTRRGNIEVEAELSDMLPRGSLSLANGQGLIYPDADGRLSTRGVAPNELTDSHARDSFAGTPWHKFVPARLEKVSRDATSAV